jgi:hypothetical protein
VLIAVLGCGVGFGVQTGNCSGSAEGWRRVEIFRILVSIFFFLNNIFLSKFKLFGCVETGNAPLN